MYRLCDFAQCFSGNPKGGFFVKKNQWIAALLALAMLLAMVPAAAFAEDGSVVTSGEELLAAVDGAQNGATITLANNITLSRTLVVNKAITLNMNGKTITYDGGVYEDGKYDAGLIDVYSGADLTITGNGTITYNKNGNSGYMQGDSTGYCLRAGGDAKLTILNGTFDAGLTCVQAGDTAVVNIYDGYFRADFDWGDKYWLLNLIDNSAAQINVYTGRFENFDPSASQTENPEKDFVADSSMVEGPVDNIYSVVLCPAQYDGKYYPTLADAVAAVVASDSKTGTVTLLKDSQGGGIGLFNSKGAVGVDLTIDLGGYTYTCTDPSVGSVGTESQGFHLEKGNKVTVKNGAIAVSEASANTKMLFQNYCDLTLQDLSLTGAAVTQYIISCNYGDTTLTNVSINGTHSQLVALDVMHWLNESYKDKAPTVTVNNTEANTINGAMDVYCYGTGADSCTQKPTLSITGGKFSADPSSYVAEGYVVSGSDSEGYVVTKYVAPTPVPTQAPEQGGSTTPVPTAVPAPTATPKPLATARPVATATPVPSEAPVVNEAGAVVVSTTTEAQVTESAAAAVVEKDQLAEAVAEAVAEAQKAGAAPAVRVEVTAAEDAASVAVTLPSEALTELAKEEGATLVVTSDVAEVSFDSVALSAIVEQAKEEIILKVEPVQESALSEAQAQTANGQPIFELTLQSGGEVISDFKTGNATIKIPYTLAEGQQAEGVVVWYLDEDGNTTPCETSYDEAAGMVTFVTPHFSKYVIGYDETLVPAAPEVSEPVTQPPVEETTADGAKLPVLPIAIGCVAVVLVVLVVVLRKLFAGKNDESRGY